ncbi:MAG TPA: nucleotidyltransferase domain-containing protein [Burkholderiales bacterium]|nr:nucleotidyltransferase domain-containing protein [Burkholderiales bacterium]
MDDAQIIAKLKNYFSDHPEDFIGAYVFGSVARKASRATSDIDVALLYREAPPATLSGPRMRVEDELESILGRPVQAVVLNDAPVDLIHRVLRDGEIVYDGDRSARIRFEVAARREYFDLLPVLHRYRKLERAPK